MYTFSNFLKIYMSHNTLKKATHMRVWRKDREVIFKPLSERTKEETSPEATPSLGNIFECKTQKSAL
jgi:hypothetical protein